MLWQQQYGFAAVDETGKGGTPTLDSGYVLCGTYNNSGAILKIDKQGVLEWYKNYGFTNNSVISQVKQLPDSSYVMIISTSDTETMSYTGHLIKADKNGNLLWQRIYSPYNTSAANYFYGFNTTHDKGFIITGEYGYVGQPYQNMWLVKTDSLGCDTTSGCSYLTTGLDELSTPDSYRDENKLSVYPNPNKGSFKIKFNEPIIIDNEFVLTVTNLIGQVIYTQRITGNNEIQVPNLEKGIYIATIEQTGNVIGQSKLIIE